MVSSILLHVTHVDDSVRGRQGPCVYFWGVTHDQSLSLLMKNYISKIQKKLETRSPPLKVNELDNKQIYCVLINKEWQRATVPEAKLSPLGTLQVFCVDNGETHSVPLSFLRTVDLTGIEADYIRHWPPLATKFILADMVGPRGPGSGSQWSIPAMFFLKTHLENRTWKAVPLGIYAGLQGVRLFDSANKLFVASVIQVELGVPSQTYQDALSMSKVLNEQPANIKPVLEPLLEPELDMTPASSTPTKTASNIEYIIRNSPVKRKIPPPLTPTKIPDHSTMNRDHHSLVNLLASMSTSSSDFSSASAAVGSVNLLATPLRDSSSTPPKKASFPTPQANPTTITEIPDVDLAAQEILFVIFSGEPGSFFGKLGRIPIKDQDEMATELLNVYSSLPNPPLLYVDGKSRLGHHGVLQWNEDQNYHRFRRVLIISELPDGLVEVYFIDYGNSLWIPRFKILAPLDCLNHFRQPPHGIHCKLDGNISFTASEWKSLVLDKWVEVNVGECKEGDYSVAFTANSINNKLADIVRAKATPASTTMGKVEIPNTKRYSLPLASESVLPKDSPPLILENELIKNAPSKFAPQNMNFVPEQIISTHAVAPFVNSLAEFWIQLEPQSVKVIMERIDKFILDPRFINQKEFSVSIGKPCLAFFAVDGFWYRAVIEAIDADSVTVCYVDYGNSSVLQTSYLRELPLDLIKLPPLAFKCCLDGADAFHKGFAGAFESRLVELSAFTVKYLETVEGILRVQLSTSDGVSLVQRQLSISPLSHAPQNVNFAPEQMISSRAVASHIKSLTELWIQLEPKIVNSIMERLEVLGLHPEFINKKNFVASVGKPCLAFYREPDDFFPDDGRWYRAVVESVNGDTARVYYFDYGHTCEVKTSLLRDIPSDYAKQPALAFKCCLDGAEAFSKVAADAFLDRFVKRAFFAVKFLKVVDGVLHIRLFTFGGVDLFEKHRKKLTPPSTPEAQAKAEDNDFSTPFAFLLSPTHQ